MEFAVRERDRHQLQIPHKKWEFIAKELRRRVGSEWKITKRVG